MRKSKISISMSLVAILAFSCWAAAQTEQRQGVEQRAPNYFKDTLMKDKNTGGPPPKQDLTGAWAGPTGGAGFKVEESSLTLLGLKQFNANKPVDGEADGSVAGRKDPLDVCDPLGFPRNVTFETRGMQFAQMPDRIIELFQYQRVWREIWTNGHALPANVGAKNGPDPRYYGYSVGHWEGDNTLVVNTVGSDDRSWLDGAGHPHSADMKVIERYTRPNHNSLDLVVTIDDRKYYTKSITAENHFKWMPSQEIEEQLCVPSEGLAYLKIIGDPAGTGSGVVGNR
jgi:hypothetical protein